MGFGSSAHAGTGPATENDFFSLSQCRSRTNRHSGFSFGVMCDSWGSRFTDLEPDDVKAEALRTEP
jgi:hypothetical protein